MSAYVCPNCRGGFPRLHDGGCPWCLETIRPGGEAYTTDDRLMEIARDAPAPRKNGSRTVVTRTRDDSDGPDTLGGKILEVFR